MPSHLVAATGTVLSHSSHMTTKSVDSETHVLCIHPALQMRVCLRSGKALHGITCYAAPALRRLCVVCAHVIAPAQGGAVDTVSKGETVVAVPGMVGSKHLTGEGQDTCCNTNCAFETPETVFQQSLPAWYHAVTGGCVVIGWCW